MYSACFAGIRCRLQGGGGMKRFSVIRWALIFIFFLTGSHTATANEPLTRMDFHIVGLNLTAGPEYQAVPKGVNTVVETSLGAGDFDVSDLIDQLPAGYRVKAELTGPSFPSPKILTAIPGQAFDIPSLTLEGKYTVSNIRLVDGSGNTLFGAVPQAVAIESFRETLVSRVETRELTHDELIERGVTFDSSNFSAFEFTFALATESGQVPLSLPVLVPQEEITEFEQQPLPKAPQLGLPQPSTLQKPPEIPQEQMPRNLEVKPFMIKPKTPLEDETIVLPPIPGIVVFPGNIGFLHQYFSAMVIVTSGAPDASNLVVRDIQAKILFPDGEDLTAGTDAAPGDDPLRMAREGGGYFPRMMDIMHAGSDDKYGTADDISRLYPAETGQADFTIEGLKEGAHKVEFEITAILEGLPIGPVEVTGHAGGAVLVRNPDFSITLGHPETVRSGEEYDLYVTVNNTGRTIANQVTVGLDPRAVSGAAFVEGEIPSREIEMILPGAAETVRFRLISQRTGAVTATVFISDDVKGRFSLRTGVGENGIPLSPDSLILPYIGDFNADLSDAVIGLLGQAWSVATAPAGALPAEVLPIYKQIIVDRAYDFSEAGLRLLIGDTPVRALEDFLFDYYGSDKSDRGFDALRRTSAQGLKINGALAEYFAEDFEADGALSFQVAFADKVSYRGGHLSVATDKAPLRVQLIDADGNRLGGLPDAAGAREIPYADQLWINTDESEHGTLAVVTIPDDSGYRLDLFAEDVATFDLGIVLPDSTGSLQQVRFGGLQFGAGARATADLVPGSTAIVLAVDDNGDGAVDRSISADQELAIPDRPPTIVAATQVVPGFGPGGDKHGRNVAVLFSEKVTEDSARDLSNYAVEDNLVTAVNLQSGGRMAFLLLRDGVGPFVPRGLTVSGLIDTAEWTMEQEQTLPIRMTATDTGALVTGTVREANGIAVSKARVRLVQTETIDDGIFMEDKPVIVSEKLTAGDGSYQFDYVRKNRYPFMIEATHPESGEAGLLKTAVNYHGQPLKLDLFMKARGSISGRVLDENGNPVGGATVQIKTLNDGSGRRIRTDATGGYAFTGLNVGPFSIEAIHEASYAQGMIMGVLPDNGGSVEQNVTIYPVNAIARGNLAGKVLDSDGVTPRSGAVVKISGPRYQNWMYSNPDGGFLFEGVYAGSIRIEASDYATGEKAVVTTPVTDGETTVANIILGGAGRISGTVYRDDAMATEDLYVIARFAQRSLLSRTSAGGAFGFSDIPVGEVSFEVLDPNAYNRTVGRAEVTILSAGETVDVPIYLEGKQFDVGTIKGTVYRADGSVWPNAPLRLIDFRQGGYYSYKAGSDGAYRIPGLRMGTHNLVAVEGPQIANATTTLWFDGQEKTIDLKALGFGTITGTVYDDPEMEMPTGADVSLYSMVPNDFGWMMYNYSKPRTIKSDPVTGRFEFSGIYPGRYGVQTSNIFRPEPVRVSGNLSAGVTLDNILILQGQPPDPDDGSGGGDDAGSDPPPVNACGSISGNVYFPDGSRAGADIRVTTQIGGADVTVTTDESGHFQFSPIIPKGGHPLTAFDPVTSLTWKGHVTVPAGIDVPVDIRLLGRGAIMVKVLNADGTPAPETAVSVKGSSFPNDTANVSTGADGIVIFENLTEGSYAISAFGSFNRGGRGEATIAADGEQVLVEITLAASGTVTGTFLKADGRTPIGGGQIRLKKGYKTVAFAPSSSDPANLGRFTVEHAPLGDFTIEGYNPVTDRTGSGSGSLGGDGQVVDVEVVVLPRGTVSGIVLNYGGAEPIGKSRISIKAQGYDYASVTSADGRFTFAGVPRGDFSIEATDPTNGLKGLHDGKISYEGEVASAEIRIPPTGTIEGRVLMPDGGTPSPYSIVHFSGKTLQVDADAAFRYGNLPAERSYSLTAYQQNTHRGGRTTVCIENDGEVARGDIVLNGVGEVSGTIFDSDGLTPLSGAKVEISASGFVSANYIDYSAADGRYRFIDVPVGVYTVKVSHPQRVTAASASGALTEEGQIDFRNLTIGPVGSIIGTVLMPDGTSPATGGGVKLTAGQTSFNTAIDEAGGFRFDNLSIPLDFNLYLADANDNAVGRNSGTLTYNSEIYDIGTVVLDAAPIAVTSVAPGEDTINVPVESAVEIAFSEAYDPATVNTSTVQLKKGGSVIPCTLTQHTDHQGATLTPKQQLLGFVRYSIVITMGVKDLVGRGLSRTFVGTFTTVDNVPPSVKSFWPAGESEQIEVAAVPRITFTEPVNSDTLNGVELLRGTESLEIRRDLLQGNTVLALTPYDQLQPNSLYTLRIKDVTDSVGNVMPTAVTSAFASLDTIAPTITNLAVAEGALLIRGNTVTIMATVADSDTARVDFFVGAEPVGSATRAPYSLQLPLNSTGDLVVKAIAEDRFGNRGAAEFLQLTVVADHPPEVAFLSPAAGATVHTGSTVTVRLSGSDDLGVRAFELSAAGETAFTKTINVNGSGTVTADFSFNIPFSIRQDGTVTLTAKALDGAGKESSPATLVLMIKDGLPPKFSFVSSGQTVPYAPGATGSVNITVQDNDAVTDFSCFTSGAAVGSQIWSGSGTKIVAENLSLDVAANAEPHAKMIITCTAHDPAGNEGTGSLFLLVADKVAPVVIEASVEEGSRQVYVDSSISVVFDEPLDPETVNFTSVSLVKAGELTHIEGLVGIAADKKSISFKPVENLLHATEYVLSLAPTIADTSGNLFSGHVLNFTTIPENSATSKIRVRLLLRSCSKPVGTIRLR